ncbi:SRPBCC family protein [Bacillus sp. Marseille-Q3570]|uniref:SRPBCC family protein n=1 Tax=Bacillus sp. Marseille-Q3570 TaxID=2963522 RepID=UPI0021B7405F|nr:SRPBCC family protein [Bacillus sp. Marseille-Q3570]
MLNLIKMKIEKPAYEVFEAFVDPDKIGNFWFSSSSARWETGETITLKYDLFNAEGEIEVIETVENQKIQFNWGLAEELHTVTIILNEIDQSTTVVEVREEGFKDHDEELINKMLDNKEGWVFMLTCLKGYLEFGVNKLREGLVK